MRVCTREGTRRGHVVEGVPLLASESAVHVVPCRELCLSHGNMYLFPGRSTHTVSRCNTRHDGTCPPHKLSASSLTRSSFHESGSTPLSLYTIASSLLHR